MLLHERLDKSPDLPGSTAIQIITQRNKPVPLFPINSDDKLTVFLGLFLFVTGQGMIQSIGMRRLYIVYTYMHSVRKINSAQSAPFMRKVNCNHSTLSTACVI